MLIILKMKITTQDVLKVKKMKGCNVCGETIQEISNPDYAQAYKVNNLLLANIK